MNIKKNLNSPPSKYYLLPFKFTRINKELELLSNDYGDYLICPIGTSSRITKKEISYENDSKLYSDLFAKNFISDSHLPFLIDNLATRYRTKKAFLNHFTSLHIFVLTLRCNQRCEYCQVKSRYGKLEDFDISYSTLDKAISLMMNSPSMNITIEFQGGEPTLVPEKISYAIQRINEINIHFAKRVKFVLCTNLIAISDEILQLCEKYCILVSTSLDGPKHIHDSNRICPFSSSYDEVVRGIARAREAVGVENVSALMTTTKLSLQYPEDIVNSYIDNGFTNLFVRALNPYGKSRPTKIHQHYSISEFLIFYKRILNYILELNSKGFFFVEDFTALILRKILTPFPISFVDLQSPSGVINGVVVYNYDGGVYASDEARMLAEDNDFTFKLGDVCNTYDEIFLGDRSFSIAHHWANEAYVGCSECAFQPYCGADPVRNYSTQKDIEGFRATSAFCQKHFEVIRNIFELLATDYQVYFPIFQSWLTNKRIV
jgi:His-Xaa-Ser system radical SAM maturase HxsB